MPDIRPAVFADLDDTLFQTLRKIPEELRDGIETAALDRAGRPRSFMTARQAALVRRLLEHAILVPVTGRGTEEMSRVTIPFASWRILAHGAVVVEPDGSPCAAWRRRMERLLIPLQDELRRLQEACRDFFDSRGADAFARINTEYGGLGIYLAMKHHDSARVAELHAIRRFLPSILDSAAWTTACNDNLVAILPRGLDKAPAARFVLDILRRERPDIPAIGLGDSLSDLDFLSLCDWLGMPRRGQLPALLHACAGADDARNGAGDDAGRTASAGSAATPDAGWGFSGTYAPEDIVFLLRPTDKETTPTEVKERLLQGGVKHYSDMLGEEAPPTPFQMAVFHDALARERDRLAADCLNLAATLIRERRGRGPIILASLARAGCPLGVLLARAIRLLGADVRHYGISIIRDRGMDAVALDFLERRWSLENVFFVDGWTGKGAIAGELHRSLAGRCDPRLVVLADPCGAAWLAASDEDWLIPFGILGAPVSGLISRTLWAADGPHQCRVWHELADWDQGRCLAATVASAWTPAALAAAHPLEWPEERRAALSRRTGDILRAIGTAYGVDDWKRVKPGIAEATRALLRRVPDRVLLRNRDDPDVRLITGLAERAGVPVDVLGEDIAPYRAVTLIASIHAPVQGAA